MPQPAKNWRDRIRRAFLARDEGELENAINDLPDNAELHLHIAPNGGGGEEEGLGDEGAPPPDMPPADQGAMPQMPPGVMDRAIRAHDQELEEIWQAIENAEKALVMGMNSDDARQVRRRLGDSSTKHRDARRKRMKIRPRDQDKEDEDDDGDETADQFRDPPPAGESGNRKILPGFEMEAPPGTADKYRKARDSAFMADSYQEACAYAEILVPGIRIPTFDSTARPKTSFDQLCAFRARVVDLAWNQPETRELIEEISGRRFTGDVKSMNCQQVRDLFVAVGAAKAREQSQASRGRMPEPGELLQPVSVMSLADVNVMNSKFFADKKHH